MKRLSFFLMIGWIAWGADPAITATVHGGAPRIFIEPDTGMVSYIAAAFVKKKVPAVVTENRDDARFVLSGTVQEKPESTGGKIARCLFLYCAGVNGTQTASVRLSDTKSKEVIWAYTVQKQSAQAYQSTAEAVAKHKKRFLEEHPE